MSELIRRIIAIIMSINSLFSSLFLKELPDRNLYPPESGLTRVMTFNLRYTFNSTRADAALKLIGEYYPDSVGLQECTTEWMAAIKDYLTDYGFVGVGRDNGTRDENSGEMCAILYRKDKYKLVDSGTFWLSDTPDTPSDGWDGACRRICTWAVLKNKKTAETYVHVNTHLDHKGKTARENGFELVREKVTEFDMPVVLTGDFNFKDNSKEFNMVENSGLVYTKDAAAETMTGITYHAYAPETKEVPHIIDYILVNGYVESVSSYKILTEKVDGQFVSDHYPVISDIRL